MRRRPQRIVALAQVALLVPTLALAQPAVAPREGGSVAGSERSARRTGRRRRPPVLQTRRGAPRLRVVAEVRTSVQPKSVELSPDGRRLWVCNFGRLDEHNVYVYDAESLEQVGTVAFPGNAVETAFSPDGRVAYVSNFRRGVVEVIDTASLTVTGEIEVGANPKFMVVSPDGATLYVALYTQRQVAVVDTASGRVRRRLGTGEQPRGMAMLPDGTLLVASFRSDFVQVFGADGEERRRFRTCAFPRHLQLDATGRRLVVTCTLGSVQTYEVDTGYRRLIAPTGRNPRTLGVTPDGRWAATANFHSSDVTLVDLAGRRHRTSEVPGADQLVGLTMRLSQDGPEGAPRLRVYATSWNNRRLFVLEPVGPLPDAPPGWLAEPPEPPGADDEPETDEPRGHREPAPGSSGGGAHGENRARGHRQLAACLPRATCDTPPEVDG